MSMRFSSSACSTSRAREALALWHGDALADVAAEPFAAADIRRPGPPPLPSVAELGLDVPQRPETPVRQPPRPAGRQPRDRPRPRRRADGGIADRPARVPDLA